MEETDLEPLSGPEVSSKNVSNKSDEISYDYLILLKKRIILTDELLRKFSETLSENEKLKAEKNKCIEELQQCRQSLCSQLSNQTDWQKRYNELETRLLATQQDLELKTNVVQAHDFVVRQYVNLVQEKDEDIKKLKTENELLKSKKKSERPKEIKWKEKYEVASNRCDKLKGIIEDLQTCLEKINIGIFPENYDQYRTEERDIEKCIRASSSHE